MKPLLFRLKIALLSLLMSGLLLVGFGVFFLVAIQRVGMARIDDGLRALGEPQIRARQPVEHWESFDQSLAFIYGESPSQQTAVRVVDAAGRLIFASAHWPAALDDLTIPELVVAYRPGSPGPEGDAAQRPGEPPGPANGPGLRNPDGGGFIEWLDRDGDGRVSPDEFDGPPQHFFMEDRDGDGFISSEEIPSGPPRGGRRARPADAAPGGELQRLGRPRIPVFETYDTPDGPWRVGFLGNDLMTLVVATELSGLRREAAFFRNAFFIVTPLALLLLGAGGWLLATRALRPVAVITRTAESITARELHRRVPAMSVDAELQRLVDVMNGMLERLDRSFHQAARFSADAAHELQTPLTVLQGELDNAIHAAVAGSLEQQRYSALLEEVRGLKAVVQKLLLLARADVGQLPLSLADLDLGEVVRGGIEDLLAVAPDVEEEDDIQTGIVVQADKHLLGQVVRNMVTNAVKYRTEGGSVRFVLQERDGAAHFTLSNAGAEIPEAERERVFDRFYRVDKSRNRDVRGTGLGLSLAREIARAHGGDLVLDPYRHGNVSFTLTLPLSPA